VSRTVPLWGGHCPLAAERFALMGDVYLWVGALDSADYTVTPPDGRPPTREFAGERLHVISLDAYPECDLDSNAAMLDVMESR
jgi:uncharacterized hydantoinase/oxoprolinase family protein